MLMLAALACEREAQWRTVVSEEAGYSVEVPSPPRTNSQKAHSVYGAHEVVFAVSVDAGVTYSVMHVDLPVEALAKPKKLLAMTVQSAMKDLNSKLVVAREAKYEGFEGRAFEASNWRKRPVFGRIYVVGRRLYRLTVSGLNVSADREQATRFLDSFRLRLDVS